MDLDEFLRINNAIMNKIMSTKPRDIVRWYTIINKGNMNIRIQLFLSKKLASLTSDVVLKEAIHRRAYIGACAMMYMHPRFIDELTSEAEKILLTPTSMLNEEKITKIAELKSYTDARECLRFFFHELVSGRPLNPKLMPLCEKYYNSGIMLPHLGLLIHDSQRIDVGSIAHVREIAYNYLVTWFLGVIRDISYGSLGAGEIGTFGAHVGRGKTTTVFHSLRTALMSIGFDQRQAEEYSSKLIIFDPELTLDVIDSILTNEVKVPFLIIDNASSAFPRHWIQIGGDLMKRFLKFNRILANIRALSGITLFIPNAPDEIASFIRNASTLRVKGFKIDYPKLVATVFKWDKPALSIKSDEIVTSSTIVSIFIYPLLKLPEKVYELDQKEKNKVARKEVSELKAKTIEIIEKKTKTGGEAQ